MNLSLGIVGLPNIGKSTLFNALTKLEILAENRPFATIEPNTGIVPLQDKRLDALTKLSGSKKTIPAVVEFVDIAGLVKGAAEGAGLGNQFLGHIKQTGALIHLVRMFKDESIIHVENRVDPKSDIEIIESELILKDLETVQKRMNETMVRMKAKREASTEEYQALLERLRDHMNEGKLANTLDISGDERVLLHDLNLITLKPVIYVANVDEGDLHMPDAELRGKMGLEEKAITAAISVKTEADLVALEPNEQAEYLDSLGLQESGLSKVARIGYDSLGLIHFFTTGEKETRAWTIKKGTRAPQAAGTIHTDFEKKFIRMEVVSCEELLQA
ncbi:MAG: redox-regulated ATPase YchF, partial [Candidatus Dojkabacteria bacterium]